VSQSWRSQPAAKHMAQVMPVRCELVLIGIVVSASGGVVIAGYTDENMCVAVRARGRGESVLAYSRARR